MNIQEQLYSLRDEEYAVFQAKLTPTVAPELFIGVRVPVLRKFANEFAKDAACEQFLNTLPHTYYDEYLLHGLLVSKIKDFETCVDAINKFLPYVDNWAVCDMTSPKVFAKHKDVLLPLVKEWIASSEVYTCRFGIGMLMRHYLDQDFKPEYAGIPATIHTTEYYINMMIAWYYATALAKQWDAVIPYIEERRLDPWVHRKTIQKAVESYRMTEEQKNYLKSFR